MDRRLFDIKMVIKDNVEISILSAINVFKQLSIHSNQSNIPLPKGRDSRSGKLKVDIRNVWNGSQSPISVNISAKYFR